MCITQLVGANNILRKTTFVTCLEAHKISAVYLLLLFFFLHTKLVVNTLLYVIKFHHYCCISLHLPFATISTTNTFVVVDHWFVMFPTFAFSPFFTNCKIKTFNLIIQLILPYNILVEPLYFQKKKISLFKIITLT